MRNKISHYLDWSREGRSGIWRYIVLLLIGYLLMILGAIPGIALLGKFGDLGDYSIVFRHLSLLLPFIIIVVLYHWLFARPGYALLSATKNIGWKDFGFGMLIIFVLLGITSLVGYWQGEVSFQG